MTRRRFVQLSGVVATGATVAGCGALSYVNAPTPPASSFRDATLTLGPTRITALKTGAVAVKATHREYGGLVALRLPAIALDPRWTPWMPITCWLIEHPEGAIMVDTGETAQVAEPGYFACDAATRFVYERLLRFDVSREVEVDAQLNALGVPAETIRTVALTHLHSDHAGGLKHFPNATFLTSEAEARQAPAGAVSCRWPSFFQPTPVTYGDGPFGAFAESHALTTDGAVRLVPTPGHTRGHQSVLICHADEWALLAGDASFSRDQVERRAVAGICEDVKTARRTLAVIAEHLEQYETTYMASHALPDGEG